MGHSFYTTLGVPSAASPEEVKRAYKKAALQNHPDKGGDAAAFQRIQEAYDTLKDDGKRRLYDQLGDDGWKQHLENSAGGGGGGGGGPGAGFNFGGFNFEQFFMNANKQHQQQRVRRSDQLHEIHISLAEAFTGLKKNLSINILKHCFLCKTTCGACKGSGSITRIHQQGPFMMQNTVPCNGCGGQGVRNESRPGCGTCKGGGGEYTETRETELVIPPGVAHGHRIKFAGMGQQPQKEAGEEAGDLYIGIAIAPHEAFKREGDDLVFTAPLTWRESVVGKALVVPVFESEPLRVETHVFGVVQNGLSYHIKKMGMPRVDAPRERGDLVFRFVINGHPSAEAPLSEAKRAAFAAVFDA
jgi:DnaJ-class molecular chaperone